MDREMKIDPEAETDQAPDPETMTTGAEAGVGTDIRTDKVDRAEIFTEERGNGRKHGA